MKLTIAIVGGYIVLVAAFLVAWLRGWVRTGPRR